MASTGWPRFQNPSAPTSTSANASFTRQSPRIKSREPSAKYRTRPIPTAHKIVAVLACQHSKWFPAQEIVDKVRHYAAERGETMSPQSVASLGRSLRSLVAKGVVDEDEIEGMYRLSRSTASSLSSAVIQIKMDEWRSILDFVTTNPPQISRGYDMQAISRVHKMVTHIYEDYAPSDVPEIILQIFPTLEDFDKQ